MRPITTKQLQVLEAICAHQQETGLSPTMQELGGKLGVNRVTVYGHVQALLEKGFLENLEPGASRGLDLTSEGAELIKKPKLKERSSFELVNKETAAPPPSFGLENMNIPLLGRIAAGSAIETIENREEINLAQLLNATEETYMLEVNGTSMIEAHIQSGDYVLVSRYKTPREGDIVVAVLEDETATLKYFYPQEDGSYILQPANSSMEPIFCDTLEVRGVVSGVIRRY
ncbi:MAG: transcriptional repressor LexA [Planctomycetota bacterium]|nr:transcriptional repressor LexA [Planctomycetota bacterium]